MSRRADQPRRDDRDPAVYARLRARQARQRQQLEKQRFDPGPPDEDDWVVPDRSGLKKIPTGPEPIADVLKAITGDRNWGERLRGVAVFDQWEEVVGADIARNCRPVRLAGGILTIEASSPSWATQLRYLADRLRLKVNVALGEPVVDEVVITVARGAR